MYKSPIEIIVNEIQNQIVADQENGIYKAISSYGINVDKDELVRALQYDRKQYNEGYYDGYRDFANKLYSAFREHYSMYKDDALVKMSTVVELIREVKDEIYVNTNY